MSGPNCTLLYVANPTASAGFYAAVLGRPPVETSPAFAMFALDGGAVLGLWAANDVHPAATPVGGSEIGFSVEGDDAVTRRHGEWLALGLTVVQPLTRMDFGYTFVAVDPDGHRLRVFAPPLNPA